MGKMTETATGSRGKKTTRRDFQAKLIDMVVVPGPDGQLDTDFRFVNWKVRQGQHLKIGGTTTDGRDRSCEGCRKGLYQENPLYSTATNSCNDFALALIATL